MDIPALIAQAAEQQVHLSLAGAVVMIFSMSLVLGLTGYCFYRIFRPDRPGPDGTYKRPDF